jgi:hypothetical protein
VAAQPIIAQPSGLAAPGQIIDFGANLFPNFTPVSTEFPGITVTHSRYFTTGVSNNLVGGFLTNDFTGAPNTMTVVFASPITDLSFVYHQISTASPSTIRAHLFGVVVDQFSGTWNQSQPNNFFGFTNIVFDELQIDFVGDFNVDTLAFNPPLPTAQCIVHNGGGGNPQDLSCVTLPVLGSTWQGSIATNPNTLLTALAWAPGGLLAPPVPLFGGELLVQPVPGIVLFTSPGGYAFAIPSAPSWVGVSLVFQGLRLDAVGPTVGFVPLNALQIVIGL